MAIIYTISCPSTKLVVYVGSTTMTIHQRLLEHISSKNNGNSAFRKFLRQLKDKPIIEEIEQVDSDDLQIIYNAEMFWIEQFRQWGFGLYNSCWNLSKPTVDYPDVELDTSAVRINKDLFRKIKIIAKSKKQMISGYIELTLENVVNKDYKKLKNM